MKAFLKVFPYVFENQLSLLILHIHLQSMLPVIAKFVEFITSLKKDSNRLKKNYFHVCIQEVCALIYH